MEYPKAIKWLFCYSNLLRGFFELELLWSSFDDTLDLKVLQKELLHSWVPPEYLQSN